MQHFETLKPGQFYHIYNRGMNGCNLFEENSNYEYFMGLYSKYINPIADTYAWVLMPNHFHILVRIKCKTEDTDNLALTGFQTLSGLKMQPDKIGSPSLQFSKLFNSYAQAFNKRYNRRGNLFERPFKRKLIDNKVYLKRVLIYIHHNPVHHGFSTHPIQYGWSSYISCTSDQATQLMRNEVLNWFGDKDHFITYHQNNPESEELDLWLGI